MNRFLLSLPGPPRPTLLQLAALAFLGGCVDATSIEADGVDAAPYAVDFVTNRAVEARRDGERYFGNEPGPLSAGRCAVALGEDDSDARLVAVSERPVSEALSGVSAGQQRVVVYFHGYYEDFERSCRRAAVFRERLALDAGFLLFSWPANSTPFTYSDDVRDLEASVPAFLEVLDKVGRRVGRDNVSIVAHSLGSRGLVRALRSRPAGEKPFRDLVLIAADIDRSRFLEALPVLRSQVEQLTVLVSDRDLALRLSEAVNRAPRLGQSLPAPVEGVVVRDVTAIADTHLSGHIYHLRNERVVDLIRDVLQRRSATGSGEQ
jgi:esterase/lipase superfamily enzyme